MITKVRAQFTAQRIRFLIASGVSFALMIGITSLFEETGLLPADIAYAVAIAITITVNFCLYRWYIFPGDHKPMRVQAVQFVSSVIAFRLVELAVFTLLYRVIGLHYLIGLVLVLSTSFVSKYLFMGRFVFRSNPKIAVPEQDEQEPSPSHSFSDKVQRTA